MCVCGGGGGWALCDYCQGHAVKFFSIYHNKVLYLSFAITYQEVVIKYMDSSDINIKHYISSRLNDLKN